MNDLFFAFLAEKDVEYKRGVRLSSLSSIRIGGEADVIILPDSEEKLVCVLDYLSENKINHRVLGALTNVLVPDCGFCGALIVTRRLGRIKINGTRLFVECGVTLPRLITSAADAGLGGASGLHGIPGTLGGAIYQNAGAFGCDIASVTESVRAYSYREKRIIELDKSEIKFRYRESAFSGGGYVILSASLRLYPTEREKILSEISECRARRAATQPHGVPSLGSVFKRVGETSAGYYIDRCALKGYAVGDAKVSERHAGFIVNSGGATARDFVTLVRYIKEKVYEKFAVRLEEEIEYL